MSKKDDAAKAAINNIGWKIHSLALGVLLLSILVAVIVLLTATSANSGMTALVSAVIAVNGVVFWGAFRGLAEIIQILHDIRTEIQE